MARDKGSSRAPPPPPKGFLGRFRQALGRPAARGEGQYIVAVFAVVTAALMLSPFVTTEPIEPPPPGSTPTDFTLPTTEGTSYSLSSDLGRNPILLEFMHPECSHCQVMSPRLETAHAAFPSVVFVSVAIPLSGFGVPTADQVRDYRSDFGHDWVHCYADEPGLPLAYGVAGTPTFFFIARNGTIASSVPGELSDAQLADRLSQIS